MVRYSMFRFLLLLLLLLPDRGGAQSKLPVGSHPPAIEFDHFPSTMYAFIWRNWNLVEVSRLAEVLGCREDQVADLAYSMGLPDKRPVPSSYGKQLYITLIRRNWHLLPYEQLLQLLEMSEEEMLHALKEDDFLYYKLGQLKPQCTALRYTSPSAREKHQAAQLKKIVYKHFGKEVLTKEESRFAFVDELSHYKPKEGTVYQNQHGLRYVYSYFGMFGDPLLDETLDPYPDGLLARLAEQGINGIWLHVVLNQLVAEGGMFSEFGRDSDRRLSNLQKMVNRAKRYGISVYLYMNEPRAMPSAFFNQRPHLAGAVSGEFRAMCTSTHEVQQWLEESLYHVFSRVEGLGGVFTISASENHTNCASHGLARQKTCPRCAIRESSVVLAEVNAIIARGVHKAAPEAKVIVWDWGWNRHKDGTDVIRKLPEDVWLMSVSEWGLPINRGGVQTTVGEYSISSVGPGPRARRHWQVADSMGLETVAKVQFSNTWELSSVPWIPALDLVGEHASNLAQAGVSNYMLSWSLGGYPSPNLEIAHKFSQNKDLTVSRALQEIASDRYGEKAVPYARKAWTAFSNAFKEFPYHGGVVYQAPQQYGPANLLYAKPTGYESTMVGIPYDDLKGWRAIYPEEIFLEQFRKVAEGWKSGLKDYKKVFRASIPENRPTAASDYGVAYAAYLHLASTVNQIDFVRRRNELQGNEVQLSNRKAKREIRRLLQSEIHLAKELHRVCQKDSRIGFEATNQYYYLPQDLVEKVVNCETILSKI